MAKFVECEQIMRACALGLDDPQRTESDHNELLAFYGMAAGLLIAAQNNPQAQTQTRLHVPDHIVVRLENSDRTGRGEQGG